MLPSIFNNNLFDDFFGFPFYYDNRAEDKAEKKLYGHHAANLMKTDIKELDNGYLTVSAAKGLDEDKEDKKTGKYIRRERYAGACQRSYYVGEDITEEDIKATFEHGILTLFVPKKEAKPAEEEKKYISIQ